MTVIIDGKAIAAEIREGIREHVIELKKKGIVPGLAVVLVGDDPASAIYVRNKTKACEEAGIRSYEFILPGETSQADLLSLVDRLNADRDVNGILVQLPLPRHIDEKAIINRISPDKDADGFHPMNAGRIMIGDDDCFPPCTPLGCQELIYRNVNNLKGKHLVVVGRSNIVGKPIANMMVQKNDRANCIVTICHTAAKDIGQYTRQADILVVAAGVPEMITADMVKPGAVVIDVGTNRIPHPSEPGKTKLAGDVKFDEVKEIASAITPVPGGVGPMTITMLLKNTVKACCLQNGID